MDKYNEKCLKYLVEKDPDISVLEFHVVEHMLDSGLFWMFLEPEEYVDMFFSREYVQKELATKLLR